MRGEQQVHRRRAAGEFLLPHRDLVVLHRRGDEHHQLPRIMGELVLLLMVSGGRVGIVLGQRLLQQRAESVALVVGDVTKRHGESLP